MTKSETRFWWQGVDIPPRVADVLRGFGIETEAAPLPPRLPAPWGRRRCRRPSQCYVAAGRWSGHDGAVYTEGVALDVSGVAGGHAWLTDTASGNIIDLSVVTRERTLLLVKYLGVQIPHAIVRKAIVRTERFGPLLPHALELGWHPESRGQ